MHSENYSKSLFLNVQKDVICGSDLIEVFNNLGINIGGVTKLTIESWFDTDCEDIKDYLNWFSVYLNNDNALTVQEIEEYEQLVENSLLLPDQQYKDLLSQMQLDYPEILDYETNVFELECMEDELEMVLNEECHLEKLLDFNNDLKKRLSKEIGKYCELEIVSNVQNSEIKEKCTKLSYMLDDVHGKLQQQVCRYSGYLHEFEHTDRPMFLFNVFSTKYDQYCMDIVSYLNVVLKHKSEDVSKTDIITKSVKKRLLLYCDNNPLDQLEILRQRIFTSNLKYINELLREEKLKAEIICLKNNLDKLSGSYKDDGYEFLLEAGIFSKETLLVQLLSDITSLIQSTHNQIIDEPKIHLIKNHILIKGTQLENLIVLHNKITEIFTNNVLFYMLLEKEKNDIESTDKFFVDVNFYITNNLYNLQSQIELMNAATTKHRLFDSLPIEQKLKLMNIKKKLLTNYKQDNVDSTIFHLINNFNNECLKLEQQIFFEDFDAHHKSCLEIEKEICVLRKFIINGPTMQIIAIPHPLLEQFKKIEELFDIQDKNMKYSMQVMNEAEMKLSKSKWFKIRRQLWMWFLIEPKKVHTLINQIESAVKEVDEKLA